MSKKHCTIWELRWDLCQRSITNCWDLGCQVWWSWHGVKLIKLGNRWPRVKPGELDQTDGDFSSIIHQPNTLSLSKGLRHVNTWYHNYEALLPMAGLNTLSNDTILVWYDDMVHTYSHTNLIGYTMGSQFSNRKGTKSNRSRPNCFQWSNIPRSTSSRLGTSLKQPTII